MSNEWLDSMEPMKLSDALEKFRVSEATGRGECLKYANGDENFALWMHILDAKITRMLGVSIFDLADGPWRDYFDAGMTPAAAFQSYREDGYDDLLGELSE